ncbi:MAG: hypothetical protein IT324_27930 [Anaerolineae bacterium]|nr:hypothetical protein [Anaerolineae bacterium]
MSWLLDDESIYNDPQFKGWITPEVLRQLQRTTNLDLSMGARQQRVLARLGFLLHLRQDKHNFFKRLLDVIPQCLTPEQRLNIVIVGDTMGDVSSATLFDVALLAREAGRKTNAKGTFITAHLVTDNATRAFSRNAEHDQANTGATLREIERYQLAEARPFPIYYPEIDSRRCNYLPLDNLLLYDGLSMEHLPPEQGVFADVADVITLWMDTAAHQGALKTLQDQQRSALLREQKNSGEVHCFSQGMFSYRLPAADLLEAVRAQFEQEIVRRLIMGHSNDPDFRVDPTLNRETFASGNTPAVLATAFLSGELSLVPRIPDSIFVALKAALDTSDDLPDRLSQLEDYEPDALAQRLGMLLSVLLNGAPETIRMDIFAARGGKIGFTLAFLKDLRVLIKKALHSLSAVSESNEARDTLIDSLKRLASVLTTSGNSLNAQIAALGMGTNDENTLLHRILADQVDLDERREQMAAVHSRRYLWEDGQGERLDKRWYSAYLEPQRHAALSQLFWQIDDAGTVCLTLVGSDQQGKQRVETRLDDLDTFHQALREMATRYCAPIHQSETLYAHLPGGPLSEDQIAQTAEHLRSASVVPLDFATVHAPQVQYQTILAADVDQVRTLETLIRPHVNEFTLLNSTDRFMLSLSQRAALVPFSAIKTLEPAREMYRVNHNLSNDPKIAAPVESILTAVYEAEQVALKLEADLNQKLRLRKDLLHPLVVTALADPQRTSAFVLALAAGEIETRKLRGEEKSTMWLSTPDAEKRIPVEIIADSQLQPLAQALLAFVLDNRAFDEPLVSAMLQRYCTDLRLGRQFRVWIKSDWQDVLDKLPTDNAENRKIGMDILKVSRLYADLYKQ